MGHSVTLGGERVGSGNKNKVYLHNYERSTHDLSTDFLSTMGCGMLIPFMCELVTRDDKYEIDLKAGLRTIPTKGPMFGSFKLQLDVYQCPLRLYQALLHNNPLAIGLKASQVKFPKMRLYGNVPASTSSLTELKSANNSLVKYLGISGIGTAKGNSDEVTYRDMFASGLLAYYDIFKNYYANKQEENAYTLGRGKTQDTKTLKTNYIFTTHNVYGAETPVGVWENNTEMIGIVECWNVPNPDITDFEDRNGTIEYCYNIEVDDINELTEEQLLENIVKVTYYDTSLERNVSVSDTIRNLIKNQYLQFIVLYKTPHIWNGMSYNMGIGIYTDSGKVAYNINIPVNMKTFHDDVVLKDFELSAIDDMRYKLLSFHQLGQSYLLDGQDSLADPYYYAIGDDGNHYWQEPLSGICVKTYQSDLFNNWINTEVIDGENGIAAITAISTSEGSITIDALQFSEKLYNLLNRIAVSGGTYEDYLDAAYTDSSKKFSESPLWIGGMSDEIIFEEIVQTAPAEGDPLGTIGGRGNLMGRTKGGKITVKIDEPSLLIGIVSITPRIVYTQGNTWYNTEIDNLADIHVPALDGIGFQNLIGEQLHFGSTIIKSDMTLDERPIIGKVPAWINYMTNFDRAYGDFAATDGDGYMVLNRNYECENGVLQDATTYIDPAKFNYAFAYTKRDAQNFWVKIKCDIKARRLMSAKQIPTA